MWATCTIAFWELGATHVSRNKRKDGFQGITWLVARRSAVCATSVIHRDSNHGKTGKRELFESLKASVPV